MASPTLSIVNDNDYDVTSINRTQYITLKVLQDDCIFYFLTVVLSPLPTGDDEISFFVVCVDENGDELTKYFSGNELPAYVTRAHRAHVLELLMRAVAVLIETKRSETIFMATFDANLPKKALKKYHRVNAVLKGLGYTVKAKPVVNGYRAWVAVRKRAH